jgi:hypothetical protein
MCSASDSGVGGRWETGVSAAGYTACSLNIRVRAFTALGDEAVNPCRDNGQRYRAELEHGIVERADVEFRSERFLRLFPGTHDRELAHIVSAKADGVWAGSAIDSPGRTIWIVDAHRDGKRFVVRA